MAKDETKDETQGKDEVQTDAAGDVERDPMDAGVPMLPGQPDEPVGPEDALGAGPKRGDYSDRIPGNHAATEVIPEDERLKLAQDLADESDGTLTPAQALGDVPKYRLVDQNARAEDRGDAPGKGGVTTA